MPDTIIEVEHLSARFGTEEIITDVSFRACQNQITVILGKSGCGKTVVLKHLMGLHRIRSGKVNVLGCDLSANDEEQRHRLHLQMGVLFQNGALLNSLTIAENVAIPLEQHTDFSPRLISELVRLKLHLVGLEDARHLFPSEISGGMRKRAALARAIALDPPLLFCDEPGAGLDPITLEALDDLILKLKTELGMSIVLVTHELESIFRLADRVVFLDEGRLLYEGTLAEALRADIGAIDQFFKFAGPEKLLKHVER